MRHNGADSEVKPTGPVIVATTNRGKVAELSRIARAYALDVLGLRLLSWSCRGFDTVDRDVSRVLKRLEPDLKPGAIVLLHEAIPTSAELVEGVLVMIRESGMRCAEPSAL